MRQWLTAMLVGFCLFSFSLGAQVVVRGAGKAGNPAVTFKNITGSREVERQVLADLTNCGWFKMVSGGTCDFVVSGRAYGDTLLLDVANGSGVPMYTIRAQDSDIQKLAHRAVDAFLNKEFGVDGICRTQIVFSAETAHHQREIYLCDFDGRNLRRLTGNATLSVEPTWHPDGRSIIYNQRLLSSTPLVQYDLAGRRSRALSNHRGINSGRISPDGRWLALILTDRNQVDLYIRDLNGGELKRLTRDRFNEASPAWSPDSSAICYVSDRSGRPKLYIISVHGGTPRPVPGLLGSESVAPAWSKDNKLAYTARLGSYVLKVLDLSQAMGFPAPKNRSNSLLADASVPPAGGESPSWAPDNRHVVVSHRGAIYVVDTRTNRSRLLIGGKSRCFDAHWSPILY